MNKLYFGDNLEVLRDIRPESVDLIYLDPPFNSKAEYNVLFKSPRDETTAQAGAFLDTWTWGTEAEWAFREIMRKSGGLARYIDALRSALGESDMMAYLCMMAVRLGELHATLKTTGSLYLHCDPTASHYLKIVLDAIFGPDSFRNEIIWRRTTTHSDSKTWSRVSDTIFFYTAGRTFTWNAEHARERHSEEYIGAKYRNDDGDGRGLYMLDNMTSPNPRPNMMYDWRGYPYPAKGWRYSRETMAGLEEEGRVWYPKHNDGTLDTSRRPRLKRYLGEQAGGVTGNIWTDIAPLNSQAKERLGYPTQKPVALLKRIILASSNEGDTVLDPFCGCGTTVEASQSAKRNWIGIDIAIHAIKVIEARLQELRERTGTKIKYEVEGIPRDYESAKRLAEINPYQFQWWANYLFNPHAIREQKKGADRGIDGELYFPNGPGRPWGRMLTSVKGGEHVGPTMVREFARVLDREKAELGLFICLNKPTREMTRDAVSLGIADTVHGDIPRLQIVSMEEWFQGKLPVLPPLEHLPSAAFSTAKRRAATLAPKTPDAQQPELPLTFTGGKGRTAGGTVHYNPQMVVRAAEPQNGLGAPLLAHDPVSKRVRGR